MRTLSITDCNPGATLGFSAQSTFWGDSQVLILTDKGPMVFDQAGQCVQSSTDPELATNTWAICSHRDTIFVMPQAIRDSSFIRAYSPEFTVIDQFPLPVPRFPRRAGIMLLRRGRTMGCFRDDIWWIYGESFDAAPRLRRAGLTQFRPENYRERTRDYPELPLVTQTNWNEVTKLLDKAEAEASSVGGMFELDETTRLVLYDGIKGSNEESTMGALIASHEHNFGGISTLFPEFPKTAKYGMLYFEEDPEERPDGEVTNPSIIRYRFIPPKNQKD